ncbi:MAG: hypothetical protein ACUVT2_02245 [Thiobacillaceae bacterium]
MQRLHDRLPLLRAGAMGRFLAAAVRNRLAADIFLALMLIGLTWPSMADTVHKCRLGERVVYQSSPCPAGAETLPVAPPATAPEADDMAKAKAQGKADIAAAERLRQRDAKEEAARRAREAEAEKLALVCARQLEVIRMLESASADAPRKDRRRALSERKDYIRKCGPLPW